MIQFYTGFTSYKLLKACFDFLGPAVENLNYWGQGKDVEIHLMVVIRAQKDATEHCAQ